MASFGEETGRGRSGHVSGRIISSANAVRGPSADVPQAPTRRRTGEHTTSHGGGRADSGVRSAGVARRPGAAAYHDDGEAHSSDESFDSAPPRRKPQPINAELVKLVASFAPLELAQLKAMEQKARLKKARAAAAAQGEPTGASAHAAAEAEASGFSGAMAEDANVYEDAQYEDAELEAPAPSGCSR